MPAKSKSAFPNPAATLPGEADVLANVLANLADHDAKLVYADWLEEHNDNRGPLLRDFVTAYRAGKKLPKVKAALRPWCDLVGITLITKLRETTFADKTDRLLALAKPAIARKIVKGSERVLPVGTSKLGGRPDMPAGTKWPKYDGRPLSFLAQFNLADLQVSPVARELPATGVLSVFCLHDEDLDRDEFVKGTWQVFHFPDASKLVRHEFDDDLTERGRPIARGFEFSEALMLPKLGSPWEKELSRLIPTKNDGDSAYSNLLDSISIDDHLLGYPGMFGEDVLGKKTTRHLLTIGDSLDWEWIDGDVMSFTISEADLKNGRFGRVKMTLQCF